MRDWIDITGYERSRTAEHGRQTLPDTLGSLILERWREFGLRGEPPERLEPVFLSRGSALKTVIAMADPETARFVTMAKVASTEHGTELIRAEGAGLSFVHDRLRPDSNLAASIPRLLGLFRLRDDRVALQEAMDGTRLSGLIRRERRGPWLRLAGDWLLEFHAAMQGGSGASLSQHGDFAFTNLLARPQGGLAVIDWDHFGSGYPPLFDLFSLLNSWAFATADARSPETRVERLAAAFSRAWLADRWFMVQSSALLADYCSRFDIPGTEVRGYLLEHLAHKRERAEASYGKDHFSCRLFNLLLERSRTDWPITTGMRLEASV